MKWMAIESLQEATYTSKSDVYVLVEKIINRCYFSVSQIKLIVAILIF